MDKEEAMKIFRELHDKALFSEITALETFIPELKESEDEKIRKALIHLVNSNKELSFGIDNYDGIKWSDILAWLEKQGEKPQRMISAEAKEAMYDKPACAWSEDDEIVEEIIDFLDEYIGSVKPPSLSHPVKSKWCNWLNSLKRRIGE